MNIIDIEKLSTLSCLLLTTKEKHEFIPSLKELLNYFASINELELKDTPPMYHPFSQPLSLREDIPIKKNETSFLLKEMNQATEQGIPVPSLVNQ